MIQTGSDEERDVRITYLENREIPERAPVGVSGNFHFNRPDYAAAYPGTFRYSEKLSSPVFIRRIPGLKYCDGRLPWPYIKVDERFEMLVKEACSDLVSVVGVLAPSEMCPLPTASPAEVTPFKDHYIYDPSVGPITLSGKSASNLRKGSRNWRIVDPDTDQGWNELESSYRSFVCENTLAGGFHDFGEGHFVRLSRVPGMKFFGVRSSVEWGGMACGALHEGELHLMHIRITAQGFRSCASYVLMDTIIRYCEANGLLLFLGGVRRGADDGIVKFKKRWTNRTMPAWLLKIIIRPDTYYRLAIPGNTFFPGYRYQ